MYSAPESHRQGTPPAAPQIPIGRRGRVMRSSCVSNEHQPPIFLRPGFEFCSKCTKGAGTFHLASQSKEGTINHQSINQSIMYFRIISLHIIARSQLADYRNKPGTNIGKPVFMDDPGNLLQVENRISFDTVLQ